MKYLKINSLDACCMFLRNLLLDSEIQLHGLKTTQLVVYHISLTDAVLFTTTSSFYKKGSKVASFFREWKSLSRLLPGPPIQRDTLPFFSFVLYFPSGGDDSVFLIIQETGCQSLSKWHVEEMKSFQKQDFFLPALEIFIFLKMYDMKQAK